MRYFALYVLQTVNFVVLTFEFMDELVIVTIQVKVKANHFFFPVILFIVPYKMVLTFESFDETQPQKVKPYGVAIHVKAT